MEYGIMAVAIGSTMISLAAFTVASRASKEVIVLRHLIASLKGK